jgi:5-methyltetrahydrofolate--homocysteine methyltransferase
MKTRGGLKLEDIVEAVANLDEETILRLAKDRVRKGEDPLHIIELCRKGLEIVGQRFEAMEYFLSQLVLAADIFQKIFDVVKPTLREQKKRTKGKVVLGTVQGDIHDMGKNLVGMLLKLNGFEVYDLGVDVPPEAFVQKVIDTNANIVALSGLLTIAWDSMKKTIQEFKDAGLRSKVRVMIGGGTVNKTVEEYVGADAVGKTTMDAVKLAVSWSGGK